MPHFPVAVVARVPRGPASVRDAGPGDVAPRPHREVRETGDVFHSRDEQLRLEPVVPTAVEHRGAAQRRLVHVRVDVGHELLQVGRIRERSVPIRLVGIPHCQRVRARRHDQNDQPPRYLTKLLHRSP